MIEPAKLRALADEIDRRLHASEPPRDILADLTSRYDVRTDQTRERIRILGVAATATWGDYGLLSNWANAARRAAHKAEAK